MLVALLVAAGAVATGGALGLMGGAPRSIAVLRTFALVAVLGIVVLDLLPEAVHALGAMGFLAFALAGLVPRVVDRLTHRHAGWSRAISLDVGLAALLAHQLADGLILGTSASISAQSPPNPGAVGILLAIALHTVPVVAAVALTLREAMGTRAALMRVALLGAAVLVGIVFGGGIDAAELGRHEGWVTAIASGLLVHVVTHGWRRDRPLGDRSRALEATAAISGLALVAAVGWLGSAHGAEDVRGLLLERLRDLALRSAMPLLGGLAIAAVVQTIAAHRLHMDHAARRCGKLVDAVRGIVAGACLPICACAIVPVARRERRRGASAAFVTAFVLATPGLGVEMLAMTVRFFGAWGAAVRLGLVVVASATAAVVFARLTPPGTGAEPTPGKEAGPLLALLAEGEAHVHGHFTAHFLDHFDELLYHVGPWSLVGILAAAYASVIVPDGALAPLAAIHLDVALAALLSFPVYLSAPALVPLVAVLVGKGLSMAAAITALLIGPAVSLAASRWMRHTFGTRATSGAALAGVALLAAGGLGASALTSTTALVLLQGPLHDSARTVSTDWLAAGVLAVLVARACWQDGLRAWLGSIAESLHGEAPVDEHGHVHSHLDEPGHARGDA